MDAFIKAFNRPYYLDRCIRSLLMNLKGDFTITVLDDGTPLKYLEKISLRFPAVKILRSDAATLKEQAITRHVKGDKLFQLKEVPSSFWLESIAQGSETFLLMEEDAWMTGMVNLDETINTMQRNDIVSLKLFWCGNDHIVKGAKIPVSADIEIISPAFVKNTLIASLLLNRKFKIRSALSKSAFLTKELVLPYYAMYTVSSAFFSKVFWKSLWEAPAGSINEEQQLLRALQWHHNHPDSRFGKTKVEAVSTSYTTTSYNTFRKVDFDFITFNSLLNEAWYTDALDPFIGFPGDLNTAYIWKFITDKNLKFSDWKAWIAVFQDQFRRQGCNITEQFESND
jgi:hypothetical protein